MLAFKFTAMLASLGTLALIHGSPAPVNGPAELPHLVKRQLGPGSPGIVVPSSCQTQCGPYLQTGASCATLSPGGSSTTNQAQILRCVCTSDFFGPFVACLECAPQAFLDASSNVSIKELVDAGIQQCAAAGTPVTGVDTSNLPDGSASDAAAPSASSSIQYTGGGGAIAPGASGNTGTGILTVTGTVSRTSATASGTTPVAGAAGSSVTSTSAANAAATPTVGGGGGAAAAGVTVHAGLVVAALSVVAGHFALRI